MLTTFSIAFVLSAAGTPLVRALGRRLAILDIPNERSSHRTPTPRSGGLAILIAIMAAVGVGGHADRTADAILVGALCMAGLGAIDDIRHLREWLRLLIQLAVAVVVLAVGPDLILQSIDVAVIGDFRSTPVAAVITILWLVGFTNAFNFMDGINGIASVQAGIAGLAVGGLLFLRGDTSGALLAVAAAGAAAGFLPWNLGGSIFMGDSGSATLGFMLAGLVARLRNEGGSFVAGVIVLLPFLFDTTVTLTRRLWRGERFWTAHRSHYYQRLVACGHAHVFVTGIWAGLAVVSAGMAYLYTVSGAGQRVLAVMTVVLLHVAVAVVVRRSERAASRQLPSAAVTR